MVKGNSSWKLPLAAAACLSLCSCDPTLIASGQPDYHLARRLSGADNESNVIAACGLPRGTAPDAAAASYASDCYWVGKSAIDYKYQVYKTNLLHAVNDGSAIGDFTVLALNTAGTITPGATAAKLFNALAAGVLGTKTLINQDILYKQTIALLISEMDSDREVAASLAETAVEKGASQAETVNYLLAYYEAGTFQHALVAIEKKAGSASVDDGTKKELATQKPAHQNIGSQAPKSPKKAS